MRRCGGIAVDAVQVRAGMLGALAGFLVAFVGILDANACSLAPRDDAAKVSWGAWEPFVAVTAFARNAPALHVAILEQREGSTQPAIAASTCWSTSPRRWSTFSSGESTHSNR